MLEGSSIFITQKVNIVALLFSEFIHVDEAASRLIGHHLQNAVDATNNNNNYIIIIKPPPWKSGQGVKPRYRGLDPRHFPD